VGLAPRVHGALAAVALASMVLSAALPTLFTLASGRLVGSIPGAVAHGLGSAAGRRLTQSLLAMAGLYVAQLAILPFVSFGTQTLGRRVDRVVAERVMRAVLGPPGIAHLEDPNLQDDVAKASGIVGGTTPGNALVGLVNLWGTRLAGVGAFAIVVSYRWWLAVVLAVSALAERRYWRGRYDDLTASFFDSGQIHRRSAWFRDAALLPGPSKEVRAFGLDRWLRGRQQQSWEEAMTPVWRRMRGKPPLTIGFVIVPAAIMVAAMGLLARDGLRGVIGLSAFVVYAQAMQNLGSLGAAGDLDRQVADGVAALPVALDLERRLAQPDFQLGGDGAADGLPRHAIRFEQVAFRYPGRDDDVYTELDLEIPAGRSLAVVGANGAGKTTLVKLLARLYEPTSGRITVDGTDIRELRPTAWQQRIAAIFQDFQRYDLAARDNVGFGAPHIAADDGALDRAAAKAGATSVVDELPQRWDTPLSRQLTGGMDLSGGQWQRLALARAMLAVEGGAGVLVLDEPSANLDVRAEAELYDRFLDVTAGLTTIVISHRFSTVRRADCIVVIDHGRVVERGSHDELVALGGRYAEMFTLQASRYVDVDDVDDVGVDDVGDVDEDAVRA
jgi:ATP-binding cassette subfamily B protein